MSRSLLRRPRSRTVRLLVATTATCAGLAAGAAGSAPAATTPAACTTGGSGQVAAFCLSPVDNTGATLTQAGSAATLDTSINFSYSNNLDSVKSISVIEPFGLFEAPAAVSALCTDTELAAGGCPAASQVAVGSVKASALGLVKIQLPAYAALYEMAVPPADAGTDAAYFGLDTWLGANPPKAGTKPLLISNASAAIVNVSGQPAVDFMVPQVPDTLFGFVPLEIQALTLNFFGTVPNAAGTGTNAFVRMPTNCSGPATTTLSVVTYKGATGGGTSSFAPTGCGSLPFSPSLSVSATKDSADTGVTVLNTITQPAGQAGQSSVKLTVPSSAIAPDLIAAANSFGTQVGSAIVTTPLLAQPLNGVVDLTGSVAAPTLTITIPPPAPLTLVGSLSIINNSVTFTGLPDVPLSSLQVSLGGGTDSLFETTCAAPSGSIVGTFTGQNGAAPAPTSVALTVSGCPRPTPLPTAPTSGASPSGTPTPSATAKPLKKPSLSHGSLSGLNTGQATLKFTLAAGSTKLSSFTVALPSGLSFNAKMFKKGVSVSGGKVKSLALKSGKLVVTLGSGATKLGVTVKASAITEKAALQKKVVGKKLKTVTATIVATDTSHRDTSLKLKLKA